MDDGSEDRIKKAVARWLIGPARLGLAPVALVDGFCRRLLAQGVPLWRLRAGQAIANPLASAWGVIWTRDGAGTHEYTVPATMLATDAYLGSPFQHVIRTRQSFRRRLLDLDPEARPPGAARDGGRGRHRLSRPAARIWRRLGAGAEPGHRRPGGFADRHLELIERLRQPLAAALEPTAMRRSTASLLRTYLGDGPAEAVLAGAIRRGDRRRIEAAILFSDLRGFTALSERLDEAALFAALDRYFEAVVEAVRAEGGDVLKFLGDGVLAIFPIAAPASARPPAGRRCARSSAPRTRSPPRRPTRSPLAFTATLHVGEVVYGNIGSPDRLDFTVLGPAVNLVSRLEGLAKQLERPVLCSAAFAQALGLRAPALGRFPLRGVADPQEVYAPPGEPLPEMHHG